MSFWLTDQQFTRLEPILPTNTRGKPQVDDRRVISGIVHVLQSGCRWKDAPSCYGPRKTLYNRFFRSAGKGVWERIFLQLAEAGGPPTALMLDATHAKAHRSAAGGKRGGQMRKPSAAPEADARPKSTPPSTKRADRVACSSVPATGAMRRWPPISSRVSPPASAWPMPPMIAMPSAPG